MQRLKRGGGGGFSSPTKDLGTEVGVLLGTGKYFPSLHDYLGFCSVLHNSLHVYLRRPQDIKTVPGCRQPSSAYMKPRHNINTPPSPRPLVCTM